MTKDFYAIAHNVFQDPLVSFVYVRSLIEEGEIQKLSITETLEI